MRAFRITPPLEWRQTGTWKTAYDLYSAGEAVGALRSRSAWSNDMIFTTADREWLFKKSGFWRTRVTIRERDASADLAVFHANKWDFGGRLELGPGRHYQVEPHPWKSNIEVKPSDSPTAVVTVKLRGFFRSTAEVILHPSVESLPEVPVLVAFPFYQLMDAQRTSAIAVAAT